MSNAEVHWLVNAARCTVLFKSASSTDPMTWWRQVVAEEPEELAARPKEGIQTMRRPFMGGDLQLAVQPLRVDWNLLSEGDTDLKQVPRLGELEWLPGFVDTFSSWLRSLDATVARLAFGCVLLEPAASKDEAYAQLAKKIPRVPVDPSAYDFLYQVNRPRLSKSVQGLRINRLAKWSAAKIGAVSFHVDGRGNVRGGTSGAELFTARIELDINSDPAASDLPSDALVPLFAEMVNLGVEIARDGDVP